jgi:DNA-binding transcriptional MerR regulator
VEEEMVGDEPIPDASDPSAPAAVVAASGDHGAGEVGYRGPQVCSLVGITYRQLDYWARTGLLRPSLADARGSGSQRLYSYRDLIELKVVKQLLDAGVSLQRARKAIECLRTDLGAEVSSASLVLAGSDSLLAQSDGEVVDLLRGGQGVLNIVPLAPVVGELQAAIHRIDDHRVDDHRIAGQRTEDQRPQAGGRGAAGPGHAAQG